MPHQTLRKHHDTMEISLRFGRRITVERESYTTGGPDPTTVVRWTLPDVELVEFQGSYRAYGRNAAKYDDIAATTIHQHLESAFDLMKHWLALSEEDDPMGPPERYM